jgi:chromosome segregation ATPase
MLSSEIQTALSSLASMVTRLHQIESQADLASSRDKLDAAEAAADELVALRQEVQALRQESGNAEASYAAERDGHSAALQELSTLQNHVRRYVASKRQAEGMQVVVPVYPLLAFGFGVCWSLALRMLCSCGCCILYSPPL